jgi:hypothetical protein
MNIAEERWETIKEFPNYMISSESRVMNKTTLNMVSISINKRHKHRAVRLWDKGKTRLLKVYRLKAQAFIPNPENKPQVNHKDGDRMNEDLSNMEWATGSENMKHSFKTGLCKGFYKKGLDSQNMKLSVDDIFLLRRWYQSGFFNETKLNKIFNGNSSYLGKVARGKEGNYV